MILSTGLQIFVLDRCLDAYVSQCRQRDNAEALENLISLTQHMPLLCKPYVHRGLLELHDFNRSLPGITRSWRLIESDCSSDRPHNDMTREYMRMLTSLNVMEPFEIPGKPTVSLDQYCEKRCFERDLAVRRELVNCISERGRIDPEWIDKAWECYNCIPQTLLGVTDYRFYLNALVGATAERDNGVSDTESKLEAQIEIVLSVLQKGTKKNYPPHFVDKEYAIILKRHGKIDKLNALRQKLSAMPGVPPNVLESVVSCAYAARLYGPQPDHMGVLADLETNMHETFGRLLVEDKWQIYSGASEETLNRLNLLSERNVGMKRCIWLFRVVSGDAVQPMKRFPGLQDFLVAAFYFCQNQQNEPAVRRIIKLCHPLSDEMMGRNFDDDPARPE